MTGPKILIRPDCALSSCYVTPKTREHKNVLELHGTIRATVRSKGQQEGFLTSQTNISPVRYRAVLRLPYANLLPVGMAPGLVDGLPVVVGFGITLRSPLRYPKGEKKLAV